MFKNRLYKAVVLMLIGICSCSCNKFLDLRPQNGITSDQYWQSKEQLQAAVIGIYSAMLNTSGSGAGSKAPAEYFFVWGELRADFLMPGPGISNDENNIISDNILPTNSYCGWQSIYRVINLCNNVLDNAPSVLQRDNTLTQAALDSYMAEALTIRSLMYFYLVRTFGDVPLKLKSTASDQDLQQLAKTAQKDILTQIVGDLKTAADKATISYSDQASDRGRINRFTVYALQADVALWMDNYADCITACDKIINSGKYGLVTGDAGWFNALYVKGNSNESIFELQFDNQVLNPYFAMFSATTKNRYLANPLIIDNYYTLDPIDATNLDIRGVDVAIHVADQTIYKYIALSPTSLRTSDVSYAHWIVYRYADILLMKAEACINSTRGQDALDIINQIRTRGHALATSAQSPANTDVSGLTDYLLAERGREFAFEGKRWYDLLRNAKRNNFARRDILTAAATISVPPLSQQSAINKIQDPNSLYLPIPQGEIQTDPNLVQNPFYK